MLKPGDALAPLLLISALSNYGLFLSYNNIIRLREYEETSEKAAEWSNKIAERLSKTRSTQTSGTVAVCFTPNIPPNLTPKPYPHYPHTPHLSLLFYSNGFLLITT